MRLDKLDQLIDVLYPHAPVPAGEAGKLPAATPAEEQRREQQRSVKGSETATRRR